MSISSSYLNETEDKFEIAVSIPEKNHAVSFQDQFYRNYKDGQDGLIKPMPSFSFYNFNFFEKPSYIVIGGVYRVSVNLLNRTAYVIYQQDRFADSERILFKCE